MLKTKGLLTRFGLTGGQKKGAVATEIIARIQADLPPTDPLRHAQ